MKNLKHIILGIALVVGSIGFAQQTPASEQQSAITIAGATAHIGNGQVLENSNIIIENGKITSVGGAMSPTKGRVIDAKGKHVYPGIIAPAKSLGLIEINAVRASDDEDEIGDLIPNVRSLIAYNAESKVVESMRPNGVLMGQVTPQGGRISGTSSIVQFDAWNWEDAAVKADDGIHMHWPSSFRRGRWWAGEPRGWQPNKKYAEELDEIRSFMANAKAYGSNSPIANEAYSAMQGVFDGSQKLYIYADAEKEIIDAVTTAQEGGAKSIVLVGGYESYKVIPFLKKNNIPVLVQHTHNLPERDDDDYDFPYKLPKLLVDGGLLVALQNSGASNFQTRNLPFYAGQLVGQGMDKEQALQLITGNSAKILGIGATHGTLENGKSATLFISEGDALDMRTNNLTHAFIDGREISLETHQTELWKRYTDKYSDK